ncbi:MAG: fumarylacetoacetate hydrolase family protein [Steroidobacteraceae bacterium]
MPEPIRHVADHMPSDWLHGLFVGRADFGAGPSPVLIQDGRLYDMSAAVPTASLLLSRRAFSVMAGRDCGPLAEAAGTLLSPVDLQCIKAAGVTFATSALERVIEERARGDSSVAAGIRHSIEQRLCAGLRTVKPGSSEAAALKQLLIQEGMWSQYLEVAIGPDAEVFTKAPVLSSVGHGEPVGVRSDSGWNNPEPEVVLAIDRSGTPLGAMLGNDVNLRDFEGRSALLLGKAKDNNASCALGPFIRLFDESFTMDDVRSAELSLEITGRDGYRLEGRSSMSQISRDPMDLVQQTWSEHQYPDGAVLFLGTLFAPTQDRDEAGRGFTHKSGDTVTIHSARFGTLRNTVTTSKAAAPWTFGVADLMLNLAQRGLLISGVIS